MEPSPLTGESLTSAPEPKQLELSDHRVVLMFDDGWNSVFTHAYPLLKRHNMTPSLALISGAIGTANSTYASDPKSYMSRAQIQELIDSLDAEIVSHSHTHPFLTRLSDAAVRAELV
ncbi:MAG: polysaccharide deacetylase family protein [candidate division WOR-3 bacterium]